MQEFNKPLSGWAVWGLEGFGGGAFWAKPRFGDLFFFLEQRLFLLLVFKIISFGGCHKQTVGTLRSKA